MNVVMHPAANTEAQSNLNRTVITGLDLSDPVIEVLGEDAALACAAPSPSGWISFYGTNRGDRDTRVGSFARLDPGNLVVFNYDNFMRATGRVVHTFENREFAKAMEWGTRTVASGQIQDYDLVYALTDVRQLDPPVAYRTAWDALGAAGFGNFDYQSWNVVRDDERRAPGRATFIERFLKIPRATWAAPPSRSPTAPTAVSDDTETDIERMTKARREQAAIRRFVVLGEHRRARSARGSTLSATSGLHTSKAKRVQQPRAAPGRRHCDGTMHIRMRSVVRGRNTVRR